MGELRRTDKLRVGTQSAIHFPWSHGLAPDIAWSAIAGLLAWRFAGRRTAALAVAVAVLSHFVLDGIVHVKGLPIAAGAVLGLGLWRNLPQSLAVEAAMAAVGLWLYLSAAKRHSRPGIGMPVYIAALTIFLFFGQLSATTAPPRNALIAGWLVSPPLIAAIACWLDRRRHIGSKHAG